MNLINALRNTTTTFEEPYRHWLVEKPITPEMIAEVVGTPIPDGRRAYDGTRAADNGGGGVDGKLRCYVTTDNCDEYPAMHKLINELLAWPSGNGRDKIELFNDSAMPTNLGGFSLSDNPAKPHRFVFPEHTMIEANGFLVMDGGKNDGLDFRLDNDGEGLWLYDGTGLLIDSVVFGRQIEGLSIGRTGRESDWTLTYPTFGRANQAVPLGQAHDIRLAGWTANPSAGKGDRVILQNTGVRPVPLSGLRLTNQPAGRPAAFTFPPLSFIASGGQLAMGHDWLGFKLAASQGELALGAPGGGWIDHYVYGPQPDGREVILIPPPAPPVKRFRLRFKVSEGEFFVTWEPGDGLIFRVLSSRDLSSDLWHEEAVLDTPPGQTVEFRTKLDDQMKFFQVKQIE